MGEVIWHGRGGQGVVLASSILGTALTIYEGKYAMCISSFGGQRRDAPLFSVTRFSEKPIRNRSLNADPDSIVILDDSLTSTAIESLNKGKTRQIIINSKKSASDLDLTAWPNVTIVDADTIASEVLNRPVANTVMVGVLAAVTGLAKLDSVKKATADVVGPEIAKKNAAAVEAGFKSVRR
jgi:pyruvate ferredoxin oxidoreductase gamma subunit